MPTKKDDYKTDKRPIFCHHHMTKSQFTHNNWQPKRQFFVYMSNYLEQKGEDLAPQTQASCLERIFSDAEEWS